MDKLDARLSGLAPLAQDLSDAINSALKGQHVPGIVPGGRYALRADLRYFGRHSMLHYGFRHQQDHAHKLEILDTGKMTYSEILAEITSISDVDPLKLGIMRVDYAVDIPGVPVVWFRDHVRARQKQWVAGIFGLQASDMGRNELQSFYLGKRPNCFRFYNKFKEQEKQYADYMREYEKQRRRMFARDWSELGRKPEYPPPLTYEDMFPPIDATILTRVERQIGGGRLPTEIETVGSLSRNPGFNPFEAIEMYGDSRPMPTIEAVGPSKYARGRGYREMHRELGEHRFRALLNKHSAGNAARCIREYRDFIYADAEPAITDEYLFECFRKSLERQIAA